MCCSEEFRHIGSCSDVFVFTDQIAPVHPPTAADARDAQKRTDYTSVQCAVAEPHEHESEAQRSLFFVVVCLVL